MFSSGAPKGVRFTSAEDTFNELLNHAAYWDIIHLPWIETPEIIAWCESEVGAGYDYIGAFSSGFGLARQHPSKWFCSEIIAEVVSQASGVDIPKLLCPTDLGIWVNEILDGVSNEGTMARRQLAALSRFQSSELEDYPILLSLLQNQLTA
jgi:hypothetical protein